LLQIEYRIDFKLFIEIIVMLFADRIRRLRDEMQVLQWHFSVAVNIDTPLFSKIERGECRANEEVIAKTPKINRNNFLTLWFADRIIELIEDKKELDEKVLNVTQKQVKK
jgi:hypothetical protein